MDIEKTVSQPIFFERNRVYRIYKGGKAYCDLLNDRDEDSFFPEEWIASNVKAINPKYFGKRDGVSVIKGTDIFFDDLLRQRPDELLGGKKYDCLVKYLDSAVRLPVQVHPAKDFSEKYFNSEYGKTEAWLIIATRPGAKIYFGFNRSVTKSELGELERRSEKEPDIMESVLNEVEARVGDIYLIKGGLIHAIGAGCTVIEVQEPTDFTIQPENWCREYHISEREKYIGLKKDEALDCFDYSLVGQKALDSVKVKPEIILETKGYIKEKLIDYCDTPCFAEYRHTLTNGELTMDNAPSVWIAPDNEATITGKGYERKINKGEYFFLPFAAKDKFKITGTATLIECLPSKQ